jgi:hypothetical protein
MTPEETRRQMLVLARLELAYRALQRLEASLTGYEQMTVRDILNDVEQAILIYTDPDPHAYTKLKNSPENA